jgi:hypothetical protein
MRTTLAAAFALFALSALAPAHAGAIAALKLGPEAQKTFEKTYGMREVAVLDGYLQKALHRELASHGMESDTALAIETTLVAARPNHPTMRQLSDNVALDYLRSFSLGGATLHARLLDADGHVVNQVDYEWYETDLAMAAAGDQWHDADYAIRRFSKQVADAYAAARKP